MMTTTTRTLHRILVGLAMLALAVATAACDTDEQADTQSVALDADTPADAEAPAAEDPPDAGDAGEDAPGEAPPPAPSGGVLASAENTWSGSRGGPLRLDVLSLTRRGQDFVELRLAIHAIGSDVAILSNLGSGHLAFDLSRDHPRRRRWR